MTNFNEDDLKAALTAIANGTVTQCKEKLANSSGLYQSLFNSRFITGIPAPTLNTFVLDDPRLTQLGRQCLESFAQT
ncbi:hypothetical protein IRZ59_16045 [Pseudomonas guariconensis]|uniref:hypothetical protein n=1 Tax=Pseudomonas guariconensis TaxID=1288410 RepID=UPI0018AA8086|nr:hypothetical protein [Pseudomonas guariconensis]MBF8731949.1 hypothetical protein [Pseudomonas guariconensis]